VQPGTRVRIRCLLQHGSGRLLHGLTATISPDPHIMKGWVHLDLDPNPITPHTRWSIDLDRLEVVDDFAPAIDCNSLTN
jgi:hypothetical protein